MKCPHCTKEFHDEQAMKPLVRDLDGSWGAMVTICPACKRACIQLCVGERFDAIPGGHILAGGRFVTMIRPKSSQRPPVPSEVDSKFAEDYLEACLVLPDSSKASAALSRRCLQHILREKANVKKGDLSSEIQQAIDSKIFPSHISEALDAVRAIGNFAAHPIKSTSSGEIVDVEMGEAEWTLDVIESLFDFLFVQPAIIDKKRQALNAKLKDAGKPPIKQPAP